MHFGFVWWQWDDLKPGSPQQCAILASISKITLWKKTAKVHMTIDFRQQRPLLECTALGKEIHKFVRSAGLESAATAISPQ